MRISNSKLREILLFHLPTIYYTFALKKETIWAEWVETKNANDVIAYVWFPHSLIKKLKNMQCKKQQFYMCKIYNKKLK